MLIYHIIDILCSSTVVFIMSNRPKLHCNVCSELIVFQSNPTQPSVCPWVCVCHKKPCFTLTFSLKGQKQLSVLILSPY